MHSGLLCVLLFQTPVAHVPQPPHCPRNILTPALQLLQAPAATLPQNIGFLTSPFSPSNCSKPQLSILMPCYPLSHRLSTHPALAISTPHSSLGKHLSLYWHLTQQYSGGLSFTWQTDQVLPSPFKAAASLSTNSADRIISLTPE
mgnify:CR=1 FL=1